MSRTPPVLETANNDKAGAALGDLRGETRREGPPPTCPSSSEIEKGSHPPIQTDALL